MNKTTKTLTAIWLVIVAFIAFLLVDLVFAYRATERNVRQQALTYARVVEQHASAAFERANIALLGVSDHLQPSDFTREMTETRRKQIEALLASQQKRTAGVSAMPLTNAKGTIIAHSLGAPRPSASIADRRHFQELANNRKLTFSFGEAVRGRVANTWGVVIGRRIELPDGSFAGMVGVQLDMQQTFTDFYATLAMGENSLVSLRDTSSRLLVRYPIAEGELGKPAPAQTVVTHILGGKVEDVVFASSPIDGVRRVLGFRKLPDFPVYAVVGWSAYEAFSAWRLQAQVALFAILASLLAGFYITLSLRRAERAETALRNALENQATHDLLTGLPNRRFAYAWLPYALASAKREQKKLAVLFIDLDDFKEINDEFGHEAGDLVLKTVAERFMNTIRGSDVLVRHGGDEFLVLVQSAESRDELATLAMRLIGSLQERLHTRARDSQVSASIGIALYPDNAMEAQGLIEAADQAMYEVKRGGGRQYRFSEKGSDAEETS